MRRAAKIDDNQKEIVDYLRKIGATVRSTAAIGQGFPDLVIGYKGQNFLVEVKDGSKVPSKRKLKPDEQAFFDSWAGHVFVIERIEDWQEQLKRIGHE